MIEHTNCSSQQVGEYRLIRWLGEGGSGNVYLGEHGGSHKQVAIKILRIRLTKAEELPGLQTVCILRRHLNCWLSGK